TGDAVPRLMKWGLMDQVLATGLKPLRKITLRAFGMALEQDMPEDNFGLNPRRHALDKVLADAAAEAGAEIRYGVSVQELLFDGDTVVGVKARADGATFEERATIVVGADGKNSIVAKTVKPEEYDTHPGTTAGYYSYWSGIPYTGTELMIMPGKAAFIFPTNDDTVCLGVEFNASEHFEEWRKDPEPRLYEAYDDFGIGERIRAGKREEKMFGMRWPGDYYRKPFGPGWALVGDAGFLKDPILGQGMNDAFRDADLLADAIDAGLGGHAPLDQALAGYQQQRDAASAEMYAINHEFSKLDPTPELLMRMAAGRPQEAAAS
ncbi:MAG: NAD(P)/FAD-dependent oxidoreductase, partial [Tepidiformaceae bacterium]